MGFAGFREKYDAIDWRKNHGGWIFVPDDETESIVWFALGWTPTKIMLSGHCKGSGKLI